MLQWIGVLKYANNGNPTPDRKVNKTEEEWERILSPEVFRITRKKGTERAHSSNMCRVFEPGVYACACCQTELFDSHEKFESGSGWPSFTQPIKENAIAYHKDRGFGMYRIETVCNVCDAHLGHVFQDGPMPSGLRYCINALALSKIEPKIREMNSTEKLKKAYIAGGCFWGMEELFRTQPGIKDTEVGYIGGANENPTYENHPGHAEGLELSYDPEQTSFRKILDYFFRIHNPTTVDRQGNDIGSSYRSAIFIQNEEEKAVAEEMIAVVNTSKRWDDPVATTLEDYTKFWLAEDYHQDYLQRKPNGYTCHVERFGSYL